MIKLINEIKHLTGGVQYTTTSEARAVAEKCCQVACEAVRNAFKPNEYETQVRQDLDLRITMKAEEAIRKAFGGKK